MRWSCLLPAALLLCACTWVDLTEQGKAVTVVTKVPETCERLGKTTSMTKADVASIKRGSEKVALELETLGRNSAGRMGGDTLVAESPMTEDGQQTFLVYRCSASE